MTSVQVAGHATFQEAYEKFVQSIKPEDAAAFASLTLDDIEQTALEIQDSQRKRRSLRNLNRIAPLFEALRKYSKTIEILCNQTPYLAFVWAPIGLVLQLAEAHTSIFDKLITAYAQIAEVLPRFEQFEVAFADRPDFQQVLALMYADILEFHRQSYHFFRRRSWQVLFDTMWKDFNGRFSHILQSLARHRDLIDKNARAIDIIEARNWRLRNIEELEDRERDIRETQIRGAIEWLNPPTFSLPEDDLYRISSQRLEGTCNWISRDKTLIQWLKDDDRDSVVWMKGIPGGGKTVLSSQIVRHATKHDTVPMAYHFCDSRWKSNDLCSDILRSLVVQIVQQNPDVAPYIYTKYANEGLPPSRSKLNTLIPEVLRFVNCARILIDGLDEYPQEQQPHILKEVVQLFSGIGVHCKILISSRETVTICKVLKRKPTISLSEQGKFVERDIQIFVKHYLMELQGDWDQTTLDLVGRSMVAKAKGMFLWVKLVMSELEHCHSKKELLCAVQKLPNTLNQAYQCIMARLMSQLSEHNQQKVISIFQWIACSFRIMKTYEIQDGVTLDSRNSVLNEETKLSRRIFDMCKPIIEELPGGSLNFIHFSAKRFILDQRSGPFIREIDAHKHILIATTSYFMTLPEFLEPSSLHADTLRVLKGFHGLQYYTAEFWVEHLIAFLKLSYGKPVSSKKDLYHFRKLLQLSRSVQDCNTGKPTPLNVPLATSEHAGCEFDGLPFLAKLAKEYLQYKNLLAQEEYTAKSLPEREAYELQHDPTFLSEASQQFQRATETITTGPHHPSLHAIEPDLIRNFKEEYESSAFVCRYRFCPQASIGYSTSSEREKHERIHKPRMKCPVSDCEFQTFGFTTTQALENHRRQYHATPEESNARTVPVLRRKFNTVLRQKFTSMERSIPTSSNGQSSQSHVSCVASSNIFAPESESLEDPGSLLSMPIQNISDQLTHLREAPNNLNVDDLSSTKSSGSPVGDNLSLSSPLVLYSTEPRLITNVPEPVTQSMQTNIKSAHSEQSEPQDLEYFADNLVSSSRLLLAIRIVLEELNCENSREHAIAFHKMMIKGYFPHTVFDLEKVINVIFVQLGLHTLLESEKYGTACLRFYKWLLLHRQKFVSPSSLLDIVPLYPKYVPETNIVDEGEDEFQDESHFNSQANIDLSAQTASHLQGISASGPCSETEDKAFRDITSQTRKQAMNHGERSRQQSPSELDILANEDAADEQDGLLLLANPDEASDQDRSDRKSSLDWDLQPEAVALIGADQLEGKRHQKSTGIDCNFPSPEMQASFKALDGMSVAAEEAMLANNFKQDEDGNCYCILCRQPFTTFDFPAHREHLRIRHGDYNEDFDDELYLARLAIKADWLTRRFQEIHKEEEWDHLLQTRDELLCLLQSLWGLCPQDQIEQVKIQGDLLALTVHGIIPSTSVSIQPEPVGPPFADETAGSRPNEQRRCARDPNKGVKGIICTWDPELNKDSHEWKGSAPIYEEFGLENNVFSRDPRLTMLHGSLAYCPRTHAPVQLRTSLDLLNSDLFNTETSLGPSPITQIVGEELRLSIEEGVKLTGRGNDFVDQALKFLSHDQRIYSTINRYFELEPNGFSYRMPKILRQLPSFQDYIQDTNPLTLVKWSSLKAQIENEVISWMANQRKKREESIEYLVHAEMFFARLHIPIRALDYCPSFHEAVKSPLQDFTDEEWLNLKPKLQTEARLVEIDRPFVLSLAQDSNPGDEYWAYRNYSNRRNPPQLTERRRPSSAGRTPPRSGRYVRDEEGISVHGTSSMQVRSSGEEVIVRRPGRTADPPITQMPRDRSHFSSPPHVNQQRGLQNPYSYNRNTYSNRARTPERASERFRGFPHNSYADRGRSREGDEGRYGLPKNMGERSEYSRKRPLPDHQDRYEEYRDRGKRRNRDLSLQAW